MEIKDSVALVTGAASGLGEATVRHLVGEGAGAVIVDLDAPRGEALAAELGERAVFAEADVTDPQAVQRAAAWPMPRGATRRRWISHHRRPA